MNKKQSPALMIAAVVLFLLGIAGYNFWTESGSPSLTGHQHEASGEEKGAMKSMAEKTKTERQGDMGNYALGASPTAPKAAPVTTRPTPALAKPGDRPLMTQGGPSEPSIAIPDAKKKLMTDAAKQNKPKPSDTATSSQWWDQ